MEKPSAEVGVNDKVNINIHLPKTQSFILSENRWEVSKISKNEK